MATIDVFVCSFIASFVGMIIGFKLSELLIYINEKPR